MEKEQLLALSVRRDRKIKNMLENGTNTDRIKAEVQKLVRDYKDMETTLYLMTDSLLKYAYEKLFKEFDDLREILENGLDAKEQLNILGQLNNLHTYWHDLLVEMAAILKGSLSHSFGVESLAEGLWEAGMRQKDDLTGALSKVDIEKRVAILARIMNSHMGYATFEEDEEKFTITNDACGSGGRLWRKGLYEPEGRIKIVKERNGITLGRDNFPAYCTHCPSWLGLIGLELNGAPTVVIYPPEKSEDNCIWLVYKDKDKIPEEYINKLKNGYAAGSSAKVDDKS